MRKIIILLCTMLIVSCMPQPSSRLPQNLKQSFNERKIALADLHAWQLKGAIAVKEGSKGFNASLLWHQKNADSFVIQFSGPLGAGKVKVAKQGHKATLTTEKKTESSPNAEQLLLKHTGHLIPINSLFYWIRGLPNPSHPSRLKNDTFGHLSELTQHGWKITYVRFTHFKTFDVPAKLILIKDNIKVKIIISSWY